MGSMQQVYAWLLETFCLVGGVPGLLAYDDACHLSKFMMNMCRFSVDNVTCVQRLLARETQLCVDPFHYPGHVDTKFCKVHMNPANIDEAKEVNMEVRARCSNDALLSPRPGAAKGMTEARCAGGMCIGAQACEQCFVHLSQFRSMTAYMNEAHFKFFLLGMMERYNVKLQRELPPMPAGSTALAWTPLQALLDTDTPSLSSPFREALVRAGPASCRRSARVNGLL